MSEVIKSNQAVSINPSTADLNLTSHGSDWYWAVFAVFGVLAIYHLAMIPFRTNKRLIHIGPLFASFIEFFVYFTLASNLGWTETQLEFNHVTVDDPSVVPALRQVFYARYIGWFLSWPALLYALELASHNNHLELNLTTVSTFAVEVGAIEIYVLGLLIGILIPSTYKWGYFTFAVVAQLFAIGVIYHRLIVILKSSLLTILIFSFITLIWILYPIAWGLSEGGNVIQVDSEAAFYGVLDIILFGFVPLAMSFIFAKGDDALTFPATAAAEEPEAKETPAPERVSGETAIPAQEPLEA